LFGEAGVALIGMISMTRSCAPLFIVVSTSLLGWGCVETKQRNDLAEEATISAVKTAVGTGAEYITILRQRAGEGDSQHSYRSVDVEVRLKPQATIDATILRKPLRPGKTYSLTAAVLLREDAGKWKAIDFRWEKITEI
jgi:hypothetical protein